MEPPTTLTHPDRVVFPEPNLTRRGVARYYERIADSLLPHLEERPLTLVRCPGGIETDRFVQEQPGSPSLLELDTVDVGDRAKRDPALLIDSASGLLQAVQYGAVELHVWGSRTDHLDRPDRMVFDLDPGGGVDWSTICEVAQTVRQWLKRAKLRAFLMTTGSRGLHVIVPLVPEASFDDVLAFARETAQSIARHAPERCVADESDRTGRERKVFVDYLRNDRGATSICPYSMRARAGAPVATPVAWDELSRVDASNHYRARTLFRRLAQLRRAPWPDYDELQQRLP